MAHGHYPRKSNQTKRPLPQPLSDWNLRALVHLSKTHQHLHSRTIPSTGFKHTDFVTDWRVGALLEISEETHRWKGHCTHLLELKRSVLTRSPGKSKSVIGGMGRKDLPTRGHRSTLAVAGRAAPMRRAGCSEGSCNYRART